MLQMKKLGPQGSGEVLLVVGHAVQVALSQWTASWASFPLLRPLGTDNSPWSLPRTAPQSISLVWQQVLQLRGLLDVSFLMVVVKCCGLLLEHEALQPGQLDSLSCQ